MSSFDALTVPLAGIHLIDASAGTGKTHTISDLVLRLLLEKNIAIRDILIVTYTEAATEELREKVRAKILHAHKIFSAGNEDVTSYYERLMIKIPDHDLARQRLREALQGFDEAAIFTIHGFCQRMLWENNLETGTLFDTELAADERFLLEEITEDFLRLHLYNASVLFAAYAYKYLQPKEMSTLLQTNLNKPDLDIIPSLSMDSAAAGIDELEKDFCEQFENARKSWSASKEQIVEAINGDNLKKNFYRPAHVNNWLLLLDGLFSQAGPTVVFFEKFEKFTSSSMKNCTKKGCTPPKHIFFDLCEDLYNQAQALLGGYDRVITFLKRELFFYARKELRLRKHKQNIHSFDDLLRQLRDSLINDDSGRLARRIQTKYPVAMIDEFQDTDPVQYAVFEKIYGKGDGLLFFIGDPKQSIYSFRGADIFTYIKAASKADTRATLYENWRSSPGLIKAVNAVFKHKQGLNSPFLFKEIGFVEVVPAKKRSEKLFAAEGFDQAPLQVWFIARQDEKGKPIGKETATAIVCDAFAKEITSLLDPNRGGKVTIDRIPLAPSDIAILVRTNRQAAKMQEVLGKHGIASVLHSSGNLFSSREASEFEYVLAAIAEPANEGRLKGALATEMMGFAGEAMDVFVDENPALEEKRAAFNICHDLWRQFGFMRMFREFLEKQEVRQRLLGYVDGERRMTNVLHLMEVLHRAESENNFGPQHLLQFLANRIADSDNSEDEEHQLRLESDADRVKIVTIHKAKGLQYNIVFCPFLWVGPRVLGEKEFIFHGNDAAQPVLDLGSEACEENRQQAMLEQLAEDIRLLYVALTRAELRCYLSWGAVRGAGFSGLAYLFHHRDGADANFEGIGLENMTDKEINDDIEKLVLESGGTISVRNVSEGQGKRIEAKSAEMIPLACRVFSGAIDTSWRISSFSSLAASGHKWVAEKPDYDEGQLAEEFRPEETGDEDTFSHVLNFPHGAAAGTFMHDILEHQDFTGGTESISENVHSKLEQYGYDMNWHPALCAMLENVLQVNLWDDQPGFKLANVPNSKKSTEMEFYFPVEQISTDSLLDVFQGFYCDKRFPIFLEKMAQSNSQKFSGFLKGFIDLFFEFQGKYYLLDWKSNYLGDEVEHYHHSTLGKVMQNEMYTLQYHIYTVALHLYLAGRLPDYRYEKYFGGVFYIFLRGVDRRSGPEFGIFYDRPEPDFIRLLQDCLHSGVH